MNTKKTMLAVLLLASSVFQAKAQESYEDLDGKYATFGKLIEGIEVVDKIASVKTDYNDRPYEDQVIDFMTVQV